MNESCLRLWGIENKEVLAVKIYHNFSSANISEKKRKQREGDIIFIKNNKKKRKSTNETNYKK